READKDAAAVSMPPRVPAGPVAAVPVRAPASSFHNLPSDLLAGLVVALVTITFSISCAALIFSGPLAEYLPLGIACAVISACVTALVVAWRSSLPLAIAGPDSHGSAVLAVIAAGIASTIGDPDQTAATVFAVLAVSSVLTGLFLFALGWLRV